ncbi:S-layer homology domain-containing protein [Flavonifractor sp. An91]|uniref:S-layer homology domain-containing protein n=1 Tax=Flavonifractor sp. An91 TaxID=1965665 RepID=UPI000B388B2B|nr:S-layer homology domain-containing protein [Flavonifractor sp. An91]OUN14229.1 hypothetical protein B5G42_01825 [Flavonifractor sp. An91]
MKPKHTRLRSLLASILAVAMLASLMPTAFAGQEDGYHDPAEHWQEALNRTNELDANSVVTIETFHCCVCDQDTSFQVFRVPEYTRNGETALTRSVKYSDGTCLDGESKGDLLDGTPGKDACYTGYHWTKAVCETCGTFNTNMGATNYSCDKNVYWLYDCAANFFEDLPETQTIDQVDDTYHRVTTTSGEYCGFCFGTFKEESSSLVRHNMDSAIRPELAHDRFVEMGTCAGCGYAETAYTAAKSVVADYFGVVDGQPHTVTVSDLSDAGVTTAIRYGNEANSCTLTSAPNYTEAGDYPVYYEITYTYHDTDMVEDGVAFVHLRDETVAGDGSCPCGCGNPDCGCQNPDCDGCCCEDKGCGENHNWVLLDSVDPTCLTLGYDRYLCIECGQIEKRDYEAALGHAYQSSVIREATCETPGKTLDICQRCGDTKETTIPQGEHEFSTSTISATCTSPGYTLRECSICGERHIEDITPALAHNYVSRTTPATCEGGGKTIHLCEGCGSSFITDYTASLGHSWDEGTEVIGSSCTGQGMTEYTCVRCGATRLEGDPAADHVPGEAATCTEPQLCTNCGAVIANALGHDYQEEVTAPTCTEMGHTTYTCSRCGDAYDGAYTDPTGHTPGDWIVDQEAAQGVEGSRHKECTVCGKVLETEELEQLYNQATTDSQGEAVVGRYLVIVTDTDTTDPVANAAVTLSGDDSFSIRLPNSRLLDYADQTTVTVLLSEEETPVEGMAVAVTDKNANSCGGTTDAAGQITVPGTTGTTNGDGSATVGWEDADGSRHTLTVKVERTETGRPIQGSKVSMGTTGNITVNLPDGQDMDAKNRVTVTVTDNEKAPLPDKTVIIKADLGGTAQGQTNKDGKLTVPSVESAYTDENGEAVVGQYTVIVSTIEEQPVEGALVTLLPGEDEAKDAFTILLPSGRLLDGNDQTVVTVLLPDTTPAKGLNVEVSDAKGNHAARDTDKNGQITVPDATGTAGEIIGTDTGDEDKSNTVNVDVADQDGKPVNGAEIAVDEDGEVSVTLPDAFDFDEDGPVTVTVTDNQGEAKPGVPVTVTDGTGTTAAGETGKDGAVTLPDEYHFAYIVGYGDGTVGPDRNMSRAEAAAIFARILSETRGEDLPDGRSSRFPDVDPNAWYAGYVAYLEKLGVVVGYDDGKFHAEASITREQFVTVCARLADWMELETYETDQGSFPDVTRDHWAARYVREAARNGWVVGYPDGLFHGGDEITRAEVVTIVNRMLGRVADETYIRRNKDELNTFYDLQNPHHWAYYDLMEAANGHTIVTGAEDETWHEVK